MMRIGTTANHGGIELKAQLTAALKAVGYDVADFGAHELVNPSDSSDSYYRDPNHAQ
jgi:ribose 5-phosphate isomerase B